MATKRKKATKPQGKDSQVTDNGKGELDDRATMKRTFKDMVFRSLFERRENALAAFLELHP